MKKIISSFLMTLLFMGTLTLTACGSSGTEASRKDAEDILVKAEQTDVPIQWEELVCEGSMELSYATQFTVDYYGIYQLITIADTDRFLLIPEGKEAPENIPEDIVVLQQPIRNAYVASSSVMDFFISLDSVPAARLSGTKENAWYLEEAREAMRRGELLYAGKYSTPDYELIISEGCELAIENTMIYHTPEVKEQLEKLGVPVLVEHSSLESHPLGRLEWMKLYGVLLGKESRAVEEFDRQLAGVKPLLEQENTGRTVAFFYITGNGAVNVRKTQDYVAKMIELAGGSYVFSHLDEEEENALATMNIQMEEFYAAAKDADYLIYNTTVDVGLDSLEELLDKSDLFQDFRAVREGHVYSTGRNFFQETTGVGQFVQELHSILMDEAEETYYLQRLE